MEYKNSSKTRILIDMDGIIVDMLGSWLRTYEVITGEHVSVSDIKNWNVGSFVKHPHVLNSIIETPGFFRSLPSISGAVNYLSKLLKNEKFEVVILTQPPRKADYAISEKMRWIQDFFPGFDLTSIVFAHKKYLIRGDVLFDDRPSHLSEWLKENPNGLTATINYPYNDGCDATWKFNKDTAWEEFYENVIKHFS